jgi:hypothetical protein
MMVFDPDTCTNRTAETLHVRRTGTTSTGTLVHVVESLPDLHVFSIHV